jgi:hypothetical protein
MTLSAISHYRGGAIDEVAPLAQTLKAIYLKYGVGYRLSRFQTGPNEGDWLVVVTYADATAYEKAQALFAQDPELQQVFIEIAKFAERISREMVVDLAWPLEPALRVQISRFSHHYKRPVSTQSALSALIPLVIIAPRGHASDAIHRADISRRLL